MRDTKSKIEVEDVPHPESQQCWEKGIHRHQRSSLLLGLEGYRDVGALKGQYAAGTREKRDDQHKSCNGRSYKEF